MMSAPSETPFDAMRGFAPLIAGLGFGRVDGGADERADERADESVHESFDNGSVNSASEDPGLGVGSGPGSELSMGLEFISVPDVVEVSHGSARDGTLKTVRLLPNAGLSALDDAQVLEVVEAFMQGKLAETALQDWVEQTEYELQAQGFVKGEGSPQSVFTDVFGCNRQLLQRWHDPLTMQTWWMEAEYFAGNTRKDAGHTRMRLTMAEGREDGRVAGIFAHKHLLVTPPCNLGPTTEEATVKLNVHAWSGLGGDTEARRLAMAKAFAAQVAERNSP